MKQIQFDFETIEAAVSGVFRLRAELDSRPHRDAAAFLFLSNCPMEEAERLLRVWDRELPEVKRVGISEGYTVPMGVEPVRVKCNLILAQCGETFYPVQIPCQPGEELRAAAEMNRFLSSLDSVQGVAFYPAFRGLNVTGFLRSMEPDVPFFGAMALPHYETNAMLVEQVLGEGYGIGKTLLASGFTALVIAGEYVSLWVDYILGWEPVGKRWRSRWKSPRRARWGRPCFASSTANRPWTSIGSTWGWSGTRTS